MMSTRISFISSLISLLVIMHSNVTDAFSGPKQVCGTLTTTTTKTTRMNLPSAVARSTTSTSTSTSTSTDHHPTFQSSAATSLILSLTILGNTVGASALAVSGGGLDYANIDITAQVRST
jgi:hypothetical protein